jgi:hypothetical protein
VVQTGCAFGSPFLLGVQRERRESSLPVDHQTF